VLRRLTERIQDEAEAGTLKLCVMDEAWRFIQHPTLRAYVQEALKTWRKSNAAMMLATQAIDDFASADLLRLSSRAADETVFGEPSLDRAQLRRSVPVERDAARSADGPHSTSADPAQRPGLAKVLTLNVDPKSYWIYTNTPVDNERVCRCVSRARVRGRVGPSRRVRVTCLEVPMRCRLAVPAFLLVNLLAPGLTLSADASDDCIREVSASIRRLFPFKLDCASQR